MKADGELEGFVTQSSWQSEWKHRAVSVRLSVLKQEQVGLGRLEGENWPMMKP